jgi:fused signal recognition particle receptor
MRSLLSRFRDGLQRTTPTFHRLFGRAGELLAGRALDEATLEQIEEALHGADFGVDTTAEILAEIRSAARRDPSLRGAAVAAIASTVLRRVLQGAEGAYSPGSGRPDVVALVGINGSGKTTTTAKLARRYKDGGHAPLVASCDTFRAAANEQLRIWCERLGVDLVESSRGGDAAAVAYDAWQAARSRGADLLLLDTAGRLHNKRHLMQELRKIRSVLQNHDPQAPHHAWLVVDGSLGANSIEQARAFHREFSLTGLIVSKLDGSSRGGALVGIYRELRLPVYFVGLGEQPADLQPFAVDPYVDALLGG